MHEWAQTQISCGLDPTAVAKCQFDQVLLKVDNLGNLSTDSASLLADAIRDNALEHWSSRELAELCSPFGSKTGLLGYTRVSKKWQEVTIFSKCLTATELAKLKGGLI
eukprot:670773-Pyramimonas_sp.AAC.1